ncbi:bifunctional polysaccharide deacetylase/glycosyltransferase family 2 protein [Phytohabitans sp. ZYX-F-186]|uniref:Bifunctional polysaccharide deacetylase/glycosyltransferase family 2 protein n=1 Tax=Phytohabitans maris TaxID=3071409 RepID=A0ABU0ZX21_9ACTN|nr:bifunctional polysaccharide deacetylase/glycosyltransferase family 2 protein [Phytohabitans sp. ZYX-F-186]MDQ7911498.1 bifunctional polysaccharide deacetylase/glycosyltransferase family 2 protein [Phytohabitans sp. ZYX-F-186]
MSLHVRRREPRAHWLLLGLFMLVLLGGLCLDGYVSHAGAEGDGPDPTTDTSGPAPEAVTGAGPVLRIDPDGTVTSRSMPRRTIALTFDDGPDPQWTPRILEVLARYGAHATFFQVGSQVNAHPELARRVVAEGHEIGSHTFSHAWLAGTPAWRRGLELTLTRNAVAAATGNTPVLMRPPYSAEPDAVTAADYTALRQAAGAGHLVVLTDLDTEDWRRPGVDAIVANAQPAKDRGAVVMLHDSGGDRAQTVAALDVLIPRLQARGYRFTTVSAALDLPPAARAPAGERMRGHALRWAQAGGAWLSRALTVLMVAALVLSAVRLAVQLACARVHVRRVGRRAREPLRYLGPVSVVVPAYNESANIAATVRSLLASDYPRVEVIVVDDGSTDGTADIVERMRLPGVRVVRQANAGKPAALNTGIAHARGDILVLVDGDTVFEPDAVGRLVQPLRDPDVGAVSGNTKVANRRGLLGRWQHLEYVIGFNLDRRMFDVLRCMPTVPGAIGAFRRAAVVDVGGVSSETLAEDTDFTMALIRAGWRVVYAPDAVAWTEAPASLKQLWRQRYRWCYGTMQAMWKHRRALAEPGAAGRLGRRGLTYLLLFQVALPLCACMVDVYALYGLLFLPPVKVAAVWTGFTLLQMAIAGYALRLDRERYGPLWSLPFQQVVYRQLMYLVVIQSTVMALAGGRLRWHRMVRIGAVAGPSQVPTRR